MTNQTRSKPHIILVHGGASSSRMYKDVVPILSAAGYTCIAPDLPGHGTQSQNGPFTFGKAVESLVQLLSSLKAQHPDTKTLVAGISLGGQTVLSLLLHPAAPSLVDAAIVSGASIHPPDERADWELPRMPQTQAWLDLVMEDAKIAGWENMSGLQATSLGFTFDPPVEDPLSSGSGGMVVHPPVLVIVGEHDTAMSRRDFPEACEKTKKMNGRSEGLILAGAAHNHSIDVPELFAKTVIEWASKVL